MRTSRSSFHTDSRGGPRSGRGKEPVAEWIRHFDFERVVVLRRSFVERHAGTELHRPYEVTCWIEQQPHEGECVIALACFEPLAMAGAGTGDRRRELRRVRFRRTRS